MNKLFLLTIWLLVLSASVSSQKYPAMRLEQFDVIWLTNINTNFLEFRWNIHGYQNKHIYLTGSELFAIDLSDFSINYQDDIRYQVEFLDVIVFNYTDGSQCVLGPARLNYSISDTGYTVPVGLDVRRPDGETRFFTAPLRNHFSPYAVTIDYYYTNNKVTGYFVSWIPTPGAPDSVSLAVIKANIDPYAANNNLYEFDPISDVVILYQDRFVSFSSEFKPWIFHSTNHSEVVVVDPNTQAAYKISVNPTGPFNVSKVESTKSPIYPRSVVFDYTANNLYIGSRGSDFAMQGTITQVSVEDLQIKKTLTLQVNQTDPKALTISGKYLYVGLRGGPHIIKVSLDTLTAVGYVRLPHFLANIEAAGSFLDENIYFATRETQGKVFRLNEVDFCATPCAEGASCNSGVCVCPAGTKLTEDRKLCRLVPEVVSETVYEKERGAAIAMGVLWAVTLVVAVAGWFMWYKGHKRGTPYESL